MDQQALSIYAPSSAQRRGPTRVVGISGYAGAGKDEAANGLAPLGFQRVAFADPVRAGLLALNPIIGFRIAMPSWNPLRWLGSWIVPVRLKEVVDRDGWDAAKSRPIVRDYLQRFGTEANRDIHGQYCWVKIADKHAEGIFADGNCVVFTDVRFAEELKLVRNMGGIMVRIEKPGVGPVNGHKSDNLPIDVDTVIQNDGTIEELHAKIRRYVSAN